MKEGERGELVLTSLTKEASPVIRYRTRDLTCLMPGSARTMRRMAKVTGRSDDMMIVRGVNVFPSQIEEQVLAIEALSPHYQIELSRAGSLDKLTINVELDPINVASNNPNDVASSLTHRVKTFIGVSADVVLHDEGGVPRSQGKAQRVIDNR